LQIIKGRFRGLVVVLLILAVILVVWRADYTRNLRNSSITLSEFFEQECNDGLRLTIYFVEPSILIRMPLSVRSLTESFYDYKITVQGVRHDDNLLGILNKLADIDLLPVEDEIRWTCARIHYVFETKYGQNIFNVTWGRSSIDHIVVNGFAVQENDIFLEVIKAFLPANALYELERFLYLERRAY